MSLLKRHQGDLTELLKRSHTPGGCKQAACLRCRCVTQARFFRGERAGGPAGIGVLASATSAHCTAITVSMRRAILLEL